MLTDVLNKRVNYCGKEYYVSNVIQIYLKKIFDAIEQKKFSEMVLYKFE